MFQVFSDLKDIVKEAKSLLLTTLDMYKNKALNFRNHVWIKK